MFRLGQRPEFLRQDERRPFSTHVASARGGGPRPVVGVGVGKRRWYATIFSFDRPRSRSISTERRGRSLSQAGFTPRSSSPWPLRPRVFTRASSVFIPAVPHVSRRCGAVYDNAHRLYGVTLKFDRNASAGPPGLGFRRLLPQLAPKSPMRSHRSPVQGHHGDANAPGRLR